jgi:hypothetical protein
VFDEPEVSKRSKVYTELENLPLRLCGKVKKAIPLAKKISRIFFI